MSDRGILPSPATCLHILLHCCTAALDQQSASKLVGLQTQAISTAGSITGRQQALAIDRPYGPEHIQDYCSQHTCDYRTDFNAQMLAKRRQQLQSEQQGLPQQVLPLYLAHTCIYCVLLQVQSTAIGYVFVTSITFVEVIAKGCMSHSSRHLFAMTHRCIGGFVWPACPPPDA